MCFVKMYNSNSENYALDQLAFSFLKFHTSTKKKRNKQWALDNEVCSREMDSQTSGQHSRNKGELKYIIEQEH